MSIIDLSYPINNLVVSLVDNIVNYIRFGLIVVLYPYSLHSSSLTLSLIKIQSGRKKDRFYGQGIAENINPGYGTKYSKIDEIYTMETHVIKSKIQICHKPYSALRMHCLHKISISLFKSIFFSLV